MKRTVNHKKSQWPADAIERRSVTDLVPYARNARLHSDQQVAQIAASIREWGWTIPVLVDEESTIIAGHGRVLAANTLHLETIPVMVARGWTTAQKRAYALADNRLAENAGWDNDLLRIEIADLVELGFDLPLMGFSDDELVALSATANAGLTDPDDVPEPPQEPTSEAGDVWLLGKHRIVCGSSTEADTVAKVLAGVEPHLMVTDPPYGVDFDPTWRKGSEKRTYMGEKPDKEAVWREVWELFPGDVVYIFHAAGRIVPLYQALADIGFECRAQIIWNKDRFIIGRGHYCYNHEPCFYGVRKGKKASWHGGNNQPTVWTIKHTASSTNHGAQKPVECMRRPMENSSSPGQAVYEPFSGSGTTIIAAEMTGRCCYAVELLPAYVDVAVMRWQDFTGQTAKLEETGETFIEVLARRNTAKPRSNHRARRRADEEESHATNGDA